MNSELIKAILFDFDGTLATPSLNFKEMNAAAQEAVFTIFPTAPPKDCPALEWLDKVKAVAIMQGEAELGSKAVIAADIAMSKVEVAAAKRGALFPDTRPVLNELKLMGIKTGIITRNCREAVNVLLPDLDELCPCLLTRNDISQVKPDPSHLLTALKILNESPAVSLMVGDDPMDIKTGVNAKVRTAAVSGGHASADVLKSHCPDFMTETLEELLLLLKHKRLVPQL